MDARNHLLTLNLTLVLALLPGLTGAAVAHDSWVVPEQHQLAAPGSVKASFVTSEHFPAGEAATKPERVYEWTAQVGHSRFVVHDYIVSGTALVADVPLRAPGVHTIAVALAPHPIEMEASKFEAYLAEEHATQALELRKTMGESGKPGRERYTKYAKTFVRVGSPERGEEWAAPAGHKLEIIPLSDPLAWNTGSEVGVKVLLDSRPATGLWVSAGNEGSTGHAYRQAVPVDGAGIARLRLDSPGRWFLRTHAIRRIGRGDPTGRPQLPTSSMEAEWESFFASITFPVGAGGGNAGGGAQDSDPILLSVRAVHGAAGPWAVAGYRMGQRALRELSLARGTFDLEVVHECPLKVQYTCVADGLQAATGATVGKLNLKVVETTLERMKTVFRSKASGKTVTITLTESFMKQFSDVPMQELEAKGRIVAALPDDEIMRLSTQP